MERLRDVLRGSLRRSLAGLSAEDRVAAAWRVACGPALAERGEPGELGDDGVLHVLVRASQWMEPFERMRHVLASDLGRMSGVRVSGIRFELDKLKLQQRP